MKLHTYLHIILIALLASFSTPAAALDLNTYATESKLATGDWQKISVSESGLYRITQATLRRWGFSDPTAVRIHGYGGRRINDALNASNYIDDLPLVQSTVCDDGSIVFYAVGPEVWSTEVNMTRSTNPYSRVGYYFITADTDTPGRSIDATATPGAQSPVTSFTERLQHEQDLVSPGECGPLLVGEDFKYTPKRNFRFSLPDICGNATTQTSFVAKTFDTPSRIWLTVNGKQLDFQTTDAIAPSAFDREVHGVEARSVHKLENPGPTIDLMINYTSATVVYNAWLNFIAINYERRLAIPKEGSLAFRADSRALKLDGVNSGAVIWDVTNPADIRRVEYSSESASALWTASYAGRREYVAWNPGAALPEPTLVGSVANQNLHADSDINMVIFTHPLWRAQAERIAELHRQAPENLSVKVVDVEDVYNEFSSGVADVSGLRKYLKMLYDRGNKSGTPLQFALLMGRMTYDECHITPGVKAMGAPTLPAWQQRDEQLSLHPETGFVTDDFLAMLEDGTGTRLGSDYLSIAVGRLPVTSVASAKRITDKIVNYVRRSTPGAWKSRLMALADDLDAGVHYRQTEWFMSQLSSNVDNPFLLEKIYLPAYKKSNGVYQAARDKMYRTLNDGVAWLTYVGHATNHSWTADGMFTYTDINSLYLRNLPFVYAATCNFLRWDSNTQSGGEILMNEANGGVIGMISATRPVYITYNGYFTYAIGKELSRRDDDGRLNAVGEIYRRAKNNIRSVSDNGVASGQIVSNENRLRYVLMGDPALRLATPDNLVRIETIDGRPVTEDEQVVIPARGMPVIRGVITDPQGNVLDSFNGTVILDLYDAEFSSTLIGEEYESCEPFDEHGDKLYTGACRAVNGRFELSVAMPSEIADNFREATFCISAYSDDNLTHASGINRDCYVYGFDEDAANDTEPPVIEMLALNHPTFRNGDDVNDNPMVLATVSDNVGINLSSAGIGQQMTITVDGKTSHNDVTFYYTPASDGSISGSIAYPLEGLTLGAHQLSLRVFDTNGNSSTGTIDFFVREGMAPTIFDIYTDVSPATTEANFYISHNRPDGMLSVTVTVYDLMGRQLWSQSSTGRSDMFTSAPVTWDLTDGTGSRVPRGIYVYRATITADGEKFETASRKLAVTAR